MNELIVTHTSGRQMMITQAMSATCAMIATVLSVKNGDLGAAWSTRATREDVSAVRRAATAADTSTDCVLLPVDVAVVLGGFFSPVSQKTRKTRAAKTRVMMASVAPIEVA